MTRPRLVAIVGAWMVAWVALWLSNADPSPLALAGIVAVLAAAGILAVELIRSVQAVRWLLPPDSRPADLNPQRVPRTLRGVDAVVRSQPAALHQRLVDLVDDRLATRHGIDRSTSPDAAGRLLSPALDSLLDGPSRRPPTERELWDLLNDIEAL